MGGKARWRKLQRVVGCLPQGPHASVDKHRQRRERARTRDAKRRRLGDDGEENADTILIGSKKEINKEKDEHIACEDKNENDKETGKTHHEQDKELEDKIKIEMNDTEKSSCNEKKVQEAMEQRAGVWTASPNGWVFRPLSDTTLEDELRKAQEEEDENGQRDRIHENGQRVAKFFLSDDESDSDTAIFIDAYQPVASEDKNSQSAEVPVAFPCQREELRRDGLIENSSGFLVQSQEQASPETEDVELVLADAIEEDEISETVDPLAKISTMEAVVTDCTHQVSQLAGFSSKVLESEIVPDQSSTDLSIESAANTVNRQLLCLNKTNAATSSGSTKDKDCIKRESVDGKVGVNMVKKEEEREADAAQDTLHHEADTESHSTPDVSASGDQDSVAMSTEVTTENPSRPKPNLEKEVVDPHDTRGDSEAENLFFSLYPEYHPSEPEKNDYRNLSDVPQDSEDSGDVASQNVDDQDFQEICDASQTANFVHDSSSEDSPTSVVDPVATSTPEIMPRTILHKSDSIQYDLHQLESLVARHGGLEDAGAEAGQDALELESRLESERTRQTLVGKAREWIKGVARMGATKRVDSSYGNQPILEAREDSCSLSTQKIDDDNEVFTVSADTLDVKAAGVQAAELATSEDVKVLDMPEKEQEVCFTPDGDANDIPESGTNLSTQQTLQGNVGLLSSSSWSCSPPDRGVLEDDARVRDPKEPSTLDRYTKATTELAEDLNSNEEDSHSNGEDWNATQNTTQLSPGAGNVTDHYPPEEKMHYSSPANEEQDYFTPGIDVEGNSKAIRDSNIYMQPPASQTLQACYPLPDPVVFPSTFEDSYDGPTPEYHTSYPEPIYDSELHDTSQEEVTTPYTPVEEMKVICSSVELIQAQYTPGKNSTIHDVLTKELQTHYASEKKSMIYDSPAKVQEAHNTPDNKNMEQNYTPANTETCYTFTEEHSSFHTPVEEQNTCIYIEGQTYDNKPAKGSTIYKHVEKEDDDYISEEDEEAQMSHDTPVEEQAKLNSLEREESVHHYTHVEGEKIHHTSEDEPKDYQTPVEGHWPHYTSTDEQYTYHSPTNEINRLSISAEDREVTNTLENEPNPYHKAEDEKMIYSKPDEKSFIRDEEKENQNAPHITPKTDREDGHTSGAEENIIKEPIEANFFYSTSDSKLSIPAERDEDVLTPRNNYNTLDPMAPGEGVTYSTRDTNLESHYIPDSRLEIRQEENKEDEEEENEEKREKKAEKKVEDEDNNDEIEKEDDYFDLNTISRRTKSEREEERDSDGEEISYSEKEEMKNRGREGRKDNEREERSDNEGEERRDRGREGRKGSEGEGKMNSERERKGSEKERKESGREGRKDSGREERKESEEEERRNIERNERKDSEKERKDNENEGRKENGKKERKDSEREEKKEDSMIEGEESEREGKKEDKKKERKGSEREENKEDRRKERKDSEREEKKEDGRKERKDSEREEKKEDGRKERKDSEREEKKEDGRKERKESEREEKKEDGRKERKDSEREEKKEDGRKERKDREKEGQRDTEKEEREENLKVWSRNSGEERKNTTEKEKRRPSEWEWRRNSGSEERRNSDWEKRRGEGKKQSEREGSNEEHTTSATYETAAGAINAPATSEAESVATTLDSHAVSEEVGASRPPGLSNPSEEVASDHTDVPQRGFRGGREKNNREFKSHQKHGKARHQHTGTDDGDTGGKASVGHDYAEDAKREDKGANKRRRNRRNKGKYHGEQETSIPQPQPTTERDWNNSRSAEAKSFCHGSSWEMEISRERDVHHHNKEYLSQQQESFPPKESLENSGTSTFFHKPTDAQRSNKNVPYQKRQHQANHRDKFSGCLRESSRPVERFSEEQKAGGAGEFALPGSLGAPGARGAQNSERRRGKGNEKGFRRSDYGEEIFQEKFAPEEGESVERTPLAKVWSPRIERKDKKEHRKERRERKVFDRYGEELKKGVSGTPGKGGTSHPRPPLLETPVEGVAPSGAQKREMKPSSGSLLGSLPPTVPPRTTAKLRYPEALSQPLSPPPSPPLNRAREMKEKSKPSSGEMEKIKETYLTSDPPSYARKAASQSVMYTIPETAPASPQQTEKGTPNLQDSKSSHDRPQCTQKSSSHQDTSEHQKPDQTKRSEPVSQEAKQNQGSSCKSPPPPSCDASQSATQLSTSSTVDPQTSHKETTSPSHSSFPPLPSLPSSQQESLTDLVGTPISKLPLKPKPNLTEIDTSQKTNAAEEENMSAEKPKAESEKPLGSPGRLSVVERMKFPELQMSATETKADGSQADATSRTPGVPQARSTAAAKLSAGSKEDYTGSASPRHASPSARTLSSQNVTSKLPKGTEASPRSPSPSHMTSSSSSCIDKLESAALQTSDKPFQKAASSPRPRRPDMKFIASGSVSDSKSGEGGLSNPQSPRQLAKEDWTASAPHQAQQGHSSSHEGFRQKEGSMPRTRDTRVMKKKKRR